MIKYHIIALFGGFLLDLLVGDPHWLPHPIRLIGSLIAKCSKWSRAELKKGEQFWRGVAMTILVVCLTAVVAAAILVAGYWLHPFASSGSLVKLSEYPTGDEYLLFTLIFI